MVRVHCGISDRRDDVGSVRAGPFPWAVGAAAACGRSHVGPWRTAATTLQLCGQALGENTSTAATDSARAPLQECGIPDCDGGGGGASPASRQQWRLTAALHCPEQASRLWAGPRPAACSLAPLLPPPPSALGHRPSGHHYWSQLLAKRCSARSIIARLKLYGYCRSHTSADLHTAPGGLSPPPPPRPRSRPPAAAGRYS